MSSSDPVADLASASHSATAVELADLLEKTLGRPLTQADLVFFFKRALPSIPLGDLTEAATWARVTPGGISDTEFNTRLSRWLPGGRGNGNGDDNDLE